ncbi:MAG TPA: 5'-nucleotidase C-terminal domain-containing protein, partial [Candidatus Dojkabacteria bacterium]|nr:5'-nucleotidase C-terminal domain-containing protein [Candidatus Dojkabacteria bacterium]
RLMNPYIILKKDGFDIMFTGIITEKIMDALQQDELIGSFVTLEEASHEISKITGAYKNDDIDLTILLTHIGYESDIELAKIIKPECGVDMIIGGHSHTVLEKPTEVNNILIAHAGVGSNQIGRFDITVDDDTNSIIDYKWKLIPIDDKIAKPDIELIKFIDSFKTVVDSKYNTIVCKFAQELTHPKREIETDLGNLLADAYASVAESDVVLVGSGSIRVKKMGPLVTLGNLKECFPYDDSITRFTVTGKQLKRIFAHIMRNENMDGEGECYQVNNGIEATFDKSVNKLISLKINNKSVKNDDIIKIALFEYHIINSEDYLNITEEELRENKNSKVITTSAQSVLEEYLRNHQNIEKPVGGRLIYK